MQKETFKNPNECEIYQSEDEITLLSNSEQLKQSYIDEEKKRKRFQTVTTGAKIAVDVSTSVSALGLNNYGIHAAKTVINAIVTSGPVSEVVKKTSYKPI